MEEKRLKFSTVINYLVLIILVGLVVFLCFTIYQGLMQTVRIGMTDESCVVASERCIVFSSTYQGGMAVWKPVDYLPLSFLVTVGGFKEGEKLDITCPLATEGTQDDVMTRLKFLVNQTKINECRVDPV